MELIFRADSYARSCEARILSAGETGIRLDRTVFYPTGGGQPGDQGVLRLENGSTIAILDTVKGTGPDDVLHLAALGVPLPPVGVKVVGEIDWGRRHRLMRMHTCLHLLCAVVRGEVTGGQVGDGKGRLDFNLPEGGLDKEAISAALNKLIAEDHPVRPLWITDDELAARPELVRTMSVKPPTGAGRVRLLEIAGVDLQPCGGTHVQRTGEIGPVLATKIESKGRQNRRITVALAGGA
ncbi:MAG: alanyl-tRNA editing protein [Rhodospirillales bacterium]|nr:alanyl-tRNA editing protein [Rhodospirillales bacterium]